jgi:hypothetical protein
MMSMKIMIDYTLHDGCLYGSIMRMCVHIPYKYFEYMLNVMQI